MYLTIAIENKRFIRVPEKAGSNRRLYGLPYINPGAVYLGITRVPDYSTTLGSMNMS